MILWADDMKGQKEGMVLMGLKEKVDRVIKIVKMKGGGNYL